VRAATLSDVPALYEILIEAREDAGGAAWMLGDVTVADISARVERVADDVDRQLLIAERQGRVAGVVCAHCAPVSPLEGTLAVFVAYLHVRSADRRHGIGTALLDAVAAFADERFVEHVVVAVPPSLREANRFYARLGLVPATAQRTARAGALRRQLDRHLGRPEGGRLHRVLAQRRRTRDMTATSPT
jgi:GNAT superfamily N-acetyltransferase